MRQVQKLRGLAQRYGRARAEAACQRALAFDLLNVHRAERIVQHDLARLPAAPSERAAGGGSVLRFLRPAQRGGGEPTSPNVGYWEPMATSEGNRSQARRPAW